MTDLNADTGAGAVDDAPVVDPNDISYEMPNLARTGGEPGEDGDAPGGTEDVKDGEVAKPGEDGKTDAERASEAGKTLAGRKNTLVDDLKTERDTSKRLKEQLEEKDRLLESWRPVLEKLQGRPDLQDAVINGKMTVAQAERTQERENDEELKEIAEDLGYYHTKPDGSPDFEKPNLERAEKYRARHLKWAKQSAEPLVQPLQQEFADRRVQGLIDHAVAYATSDKAKAEGLVADPAIVREMFTAHARENPNWVLDKKSGNILYERAVLRSIREGKVGTGTGRAADPPPRKTAKDAPEFVETEAPGGKHTGPRLTAAERSLGEQYGLTDKDWERAEQHSQVRRGYTQIVED